MTLVAALLALATTAQAARVPVDVAEQLEAVGRKHGAEVLIVSQSADVVRVLGKHAERRSDNLVVRRLPSLGTGSYERQIALQRVGLRCGVELDHAFHAEVFGDCSAWDDAPTLHAAVPRSQPERKRSETFETGAVVALGPITATGRAFDFSSEMRTSRKVSAVATVTSIRVPELGNPALAAIQARHYTLGDFDRGLYGFAQGGLLSVEDGTVRSLGAAVGLGLKLTARSGLTGDVYAGAGPGGETEFFGRIHPAAGARVGWAF